MEVAGQDEGDGDFSPPHGHVGIPPSQGDLMGLNFFIIVNGPSEVVVDMGVNDQVLHVFHRLDWIKRIKLSGHVQVADVQGDLHIGTVDGSTASFRESNFSL